jgi:hypothetical protein
MTFKFLSTALAGLILSISTIANAGLIVDTDNDSFIDQSTALEWMDFGVNNIHTFDYITNQLGVGGEYYGWEIAKQDQVINLWTSLYFSTADNYDALRFFSSSENSALWDSYKNIIGVNSIFDDPANTMLWNYALFYGADGNIKLAEYHEDIYPDNTSSFARLSDFYQVFPPGCDNLSCAPHLDPVANNYQRRHWDSVGVSTFLVKVNQVPEPSTLAIFALGLIGLASRRFKKH